MKYKLHFLLVLFFASFFTLIAQTPTVEITDVNGLPDDILVDCDYPVDANRCFVLEANYTELYETTSYEVTSIPYTSLTGLTNETIITSITADDKWSDIRTIPFDFCFYNNVYNQLIIGDNGIVSFNTILAGDDSPYAPNTIPNNITTNVICGVYHDLTNDPSASGCNDDPLTGINECGEIKTYTFGTAPYRGFVISYENMVHINDATSHSTTQIVLYETTNIIEVYVHEKPINNEPPSPLNDPRKNALIGIQNIDGSEGTAAPGRNSGIWSATDEAWQFIPNGISTTTIQWLDENGTAISNANQITICPEVSTSYSVNVTYDLCIGGDITISDAINVAISLDYPVAIDNEQIVCDFGIVGEETVDLTSYDNLMVGTQVGLVLTYYHSLTDAQTENNPIINPNTYLLQNPTEVIYVRLQRGVGCFDVGMLTLHLDELATSNLSNISVCDAGNDNSELITLTDYTSTILGGQTGVTVTYYSNQNDADNAINPITDIIAADSDSIFVRLTLDPDDSCPNVIEIPIELYTVPEVAPVPVELCSDIAIYDLTQTESVTNGNNTITLNYSYYLYESWAQQNINPFDPNDPNNPIDPIYYQLNGIAQIWVRAWTANGCVAVYPINFTYIAGIPAGNDQQVSTGNTFNLTGSILDMVSGMTDNGDGTYDLNGDTITVQYYDTANGAQNLDPAHLIADPTTYAIANPDADVYVVFTNNTSGCTSVGGIGLSTAGFGGGGGGGDFLVCDYQNDNQEDIVLSDYDSQIISGYDDSQYMEVAYFNTQAEANANIGAITTITLTAPVTLWVRISLMFQNPGDTMPQELDFLVDNINLDFQSTTILDSVTDTICDEFGDNIEPHYDITQYENQISTAAGVSFDYEYTNGTTITNPSDFTINGPIQTINVLVTTPDGCTTETTIIIDFHPLIDATATTIYACDMDNNNEENFNLNDALPAINANFTSYDISYYHTELAAQTEDIAELIANPTNYTVNVSVPAETVFVRLYDTTTTCYTTEEITLEIVPVPQVLENTFEYCDFENNGTENMIDLTQFTSAIIGAQPNVTITYHTTQNDADNNLLPITEIDINNSETIYVRLSAPDSCSLVDTITINLINSPVVNNVDVVVCDNIASGNPLGEEYYDLTESNSTIIADTTNHSFQYFLTEQNALDDTGAISSNYNISNVPQTIYVRVTNTNTGCFSIAEIHLTFTTPTPVQNTELSECDNDFNLAGIFDLSDAIDAMLADTTGYEISYYTTQLAAETADNAFEILDYTNYDTANPNNEEVAYVRFYATATGCFSVGKIDLNILKVPKLRVGEYEVCDTDFDGNYIVDLANVNNVVTIIDDPTNVYTYYLSNADAENETNPIANPSDYAIPLPVNSHTIYIRVSNEFGCWSVAPLSFLIKNSVVVENITDILYSCDNDNDGFAFFDLSTFALGHPFSLEPGATYRFYNTLMDAQLDQNQIPTPSVHQNTTVTSQIVYVRVSAPDKCDAITSFSIEVQHITPPDFSDLYYCAGNSSTISINNIANYTTYVWSTGATTQTINVNVAGNYNVTLTDTNGCVGIFDFEVIEEPLPEANITSIVECDYDGVLDGFMEFNLHNYDADLTNNNPNVTTHFYLNQIDLDADQNELSANYVNISNPQTLFVKIVDNNTLCFSETTLELKASYFVLTPNTHSICDTDLDGNYSFDITELENLVIADTSNLSFSYYENQADADAQTNAIPSIVPYTIPNNHHNIVVRVENILGCAYTTTVEVIYNDDTQANNPIAEILEACDDDNDGVGIFDLTEIEPFATTEIGATFHYYHNEVDAKLQQNEIEEFTAYQNVSPSPERVYVRISSAGKCDVVTSFELQILHIAVPTLTTASFCSGDTVILDIGTYDTYSWSTGEVTQTIDVNVAGTYSVTLTDANGCTGTFNVEVTELSLPTAIPTQKLECDYDGVPDGFMEFDLHTYDADLTNNDPDVTTHFYLNQTDLDTDQNEIAANFTNTSNPQTLFVKIVDNHTLCSSETTLELEVSFIQPDEAILEQCDELQSEDGINVFNLTLATPQVIANLPSNTQVIYYETYNDAENELNPLGDYFENTNAYSQTIYSRVQNNFGCIGVSEVHLIVNDLPNLLSDEEIVYCMNEYPDKIELESGLIGDSTNNYNFLWSTGETSPSILINEVGEYTVTVTKINTGCKRSRKITIIPSSIATIESIEIDDPQNIGGVTVFVTGVGDYEYAIDDENGSYQDDYHFYNVPNGLHTLYVRDKNGCGIVEGQITSVNTPKFFSPNNDGVYDTWQPIGFSRDLHADISIYIFDRYGKLLAQLDPYGEGWNGFYNGILMHQNDYWYKIDYTEKFSGMRRQLKGHFSLVTK